MGTTGTVLPLPPLWCDHEADMEFTPDHRKSAFFPLKNKEIFTQTSVRNSPVR
jgi:hypothetical protein